MQRGVGLAVLSDQVVKNELQARQFRGLAVTGLVLERDLFLVWDRRAPCPFPHGSSLISPLLPTACHKQRYGPSPVYHHERDTLLCACRLPCYL